MGPLFEVLSERTFIALFTTSDRPKKVVKGQCQIW